MRDDVGDTIAHRRTATTEQLIAEAEALTAMLLALVARFEAELNEDEDD